MAKSNAPLAPMSMEDRSHLLQVVREAEEPLEATKVVKLAKTSRRPTAEVEAVMQEFVQDGILIVWPAKSAKGKPRYWDRSVTSVGSASIQELVQKSSEPVSVKDVKKLWKSPFKLSDTEIASILNDLARSGVIYEIPAKTATSGVRYWKHDVEEFCRHSLLTQIKTQPPQTKAKLKAAVKWLDQKRFDDLIEQLTRQKEIFLHPALGKSKSAQALWGHTPPSPEPYLKNIREQLTTVVKQLQSAFVLQADLRRAAVQMLEASGISFGAGSSAATEAASVRVAETVDFVKLIHSVEPGADRGALVPARVLRAAAKMPKATFDSLALQFAREGKIVLHEHDFAASLSQEARDELVSDGQGNFYVGMALRARKEG